MLEHKNKNRVFLPGVYQSSPLFIVRMAIAFILGPSHIIAGHQ